jgi:hypothetical protein
MISAKISKDIFIENKFMQISENLITAEARCRQPLYDYG